MTGNGRRQGLRLSRVLALALVAGSLIGVTPMATTPASAAANIGARQHPAMAADPATGSLVLFGGEGRRGDSSFGALDDTWSWDGVAWSQETPPSSPPARSGAAMAADKATGTVVLFGGSATVVNSTSIVSNVKVAFGDTWIWDGTTRTWTEQSAPLGPGATSRPAMAYDALTKTVVMFKGSETWIWDGTAKTWTEQTPPVSPPARSGAVMAYDAVSRKVVLFGGKQACNHCGWFNDTWLWDGATRTWTEQVLSTRPRTGDEVYMAYHAASARVVLFGGRDSNDTWTWNGAAGKWTLEAPTIRPCRRSRGAMAYHAATKSAIIFGGSGDAISCSSVYAPDTWAWTGTAWRPGAGPFVSVGDVAVVEGDTGATSETATRAAVFSVTLSEPAAWEVTVNYATVHYCAGLAGDYESKTGTVVFAPGVTSARIEVRIAGDTVKERSCGDVSLFERFYVRLSGTQGGIALDESGEAIIIDDDPAPVAGRRVDIGDASVHEGDAGGRIAMFTVSLSHPSTTPVTVAYTTVARTAGAADFEARSGTVTFAPGELGAVLEVPVTPDAQDEANETFAVKLSAASGATKSRGVGVGTILDND